MPNFLRFLSLASLAVLLCAAEARAEPIAKLVKQLGSPNFKERQEASTALEAIGLQALDALRKATKDADPEVVRRATHLVSIIEDSLEQVLVDYRRYGLPLSPDNAKLVRFETEGRSVANGEMRPPTHFFGFLLQAETKDKPALILVGTREIRFAKGMAVEVVEPKPMLVKKTELRWHEGLPFYMNTGLALALQCKARGWHEFARELWTASRYSDSSNRKTFAYLVEAHCKNELVDPKSDRTKTAKRLKALLVAEPELNAKENQGLLKSLEAALVPSTAKAGTVERMIDDLTDMCNATYRYHEPDPRYTRLAHRGFAVVPALIEHLDNDRLTRSIERHRFGNAMFSPIPILRVKDVVGDLLSELSDHVIYRGSQQAAARAWWDKVRKEGEESYFVGRVLGNDEKADWPNQLMLKIITEKYPRHLPKLYQIALDRRPKMQSWPVADAIAESALPDETKLELLRHAANHKNLEHRRFALWQLKKLDPRQFMKLLLAALEAIPKTPTKAYPGCPEKHYANLVMAANDPRAWKTLKKVAKRSDVGLRMEFLDQIDQYAEEGQRKPRLDFLAAFLDDAELRDVNANPKMYDGIYAGAWIPRLEVRDLAAMKIAAILKMPNESDKNWTPRQWEKLRKKVKEALQR